MPGIPAAGAGSVSMSALNTEFGKGNSLSLYRGITVYPTAGGASKTNDANGSISYSFFQGYRNLAPPGVPTGLSYSISYNLARTSASYNMSWVAPTTGGAVADYTHVLTEAGVDSSSTISILSATKVMSIISGIPTLYSFKVRANNASGSSAYVIVASSYTYPIPPGKPNTSYTTSGSTFTMIFSAVPASDADGAGPTTYMSYTIYKTTGSTTTNVASIGDSPVSYTMTSGSSYYFTVTAYNDNINSTTSDQKPSPAYYYPNLPGAPTGASASFTYQVLNISWTAPASATVNSYTVTIVATGIANVVYTGITGTSKTHTTLSFGKAYYATIVAINDAGTGTSATTNTVTYPYGPGTPTGLTQSFTSGSYNISWTAVAAVANSIGTSDSYKYYVKVNGGTALGPFTTSSTSANYTTTITSGSTYSFAVQSVNNADTSVLSGYTTAITYPNAPTSTSASRTFVANILTYTISATGADSYSAIIYYLAYGSTAAVRAAELAKSTTTTVSYTLDSSAKNGYYYVVAYSYNIAGTSSALTTTSVSTTYTTPVTLPSVSAPTSSGNTISFTGPATGGGTATSYSAQLYRSATNTASGGTAVGTALTASGSGTYSATSSTDTGYYYVVVTASNAGNSTPATSTSGTFNFTYTAPPTPSATAPSATGNSISYSGSAAGASSYTITLYSIGTGTTATGGTSVASSTTSLTPTAYTGTASGNFYTKVSATNAAGTVDAVSTVYSFTYTTPVTLPSVSAPTSSGNTISFTGPATGGGTATSYSAQLYRSATNTASGGTAVGTALTASGSGTYSATSSTDTGYYYFVVTASNAGNSTPATSTSGTLNFTYTAPPTAATVTTPTVSGNTISFTVPTFTGATSYSAQLYYNATNTTTGGTALGTALTSTGSGSALGTSSTPFVFLRVSATNAGGTTIVNSSTLSFTYVTPPTGGTKSTIGTKKVHTFTSATTTATFVISASTTVEIFAVGGGGGGGSSSTEYDAGGGGGGGEVVFAAFTLPAGTYYVFVGAGGAANANGTNGSPGARSAVATSSSAVNATTIYVFAYGGGGGGGGNSSGPNNYYGSGGGGAIVGYNADGQDVTEGANVAVRDTGFPYYKTGYLTSPTAFHLASAGSSANYISSSGNGGGYYYYGTTGATYGVGGSGISWDYGAASSSGSPGASNTGNGGGGGRKAYGGAGGSGVVIISYSNNYE